MTDLIVVELPKLDAFKLLLSILKLIFLSEPFQLELSDSTNVVFAPPEQAQDIYLQLSTDEELELYIEQNETRNED